MKILSKIPPKVYLACSGGKDSMTILSFLLEGRRDVTLLYFNHNTEHGKEAETFLKSFCDRKGLTLHIGLYTGSEQTEESWREARYEFLESFTDFPIITGHHLNDNIETWLLSSISGTSKFIPYSRNNIIRPFLLSSLDELDRYRKHRDVIWVEDPSNSENNYSRNKIRNNVVPILKEINKGLEKVFYWKCYSKYEKDGLL